jgi:drug/metabolite transporter (DMT)-like permease
MSRQGVAHLALLFVAMVYGANYLVAKGLMPQMIGPSGFIVLRVVGAGMLFWLVYAINWEPVARRHLGRLMLCGLFGVAANQLMFFNGLSLTSPVNASIIMTSNPILVLLASSFLLKTAITARKLAGIGLGAFGAILLLLQSKDTGAAHISWQGDLLILLNATSYGVYLVLVKPLMSIYKPTTVVAWVFLFGAVVVLPIGLPQALAIPWQEFTTNQYLSVAFVVVFTTFVVYLLNIFAMRTVMPTVVSMYIYLQPLFAGLFAYVYALYGGDDFTGDFTVGRIASAALIFTGVYLVSSARK